MCQRYDLLDQSLIMFHEERGFSDYHVHVSRLLRFGADTHGVFTLLETLDHGRREVHLPRGDD
jgi:hypothetical protein